MDQTKDEILFLQLREVAQETEVNLGDRAHCFVDLYNDWLQILGRCSDVYSREVLLNSLFAADFHSLGKDLHWMHRLLHWGNYPLIHRILRYDWELMFRAYYADVYVPCIPGDSDVPGETLDDKVKWLERREHGLHFNAVIGPILNVILGEKDREYYKGIWRSLNQYVHPTKEIRHRLIEESALAVRDSFDKKWADETIGVACDVLDLIWLLATIRFPKCVSVFEAPNRFRHTPRVSGIVRAGRDTRRAN